MVFKKASKPINTFWQGSFIAFQTSDKQWRKGEIMRLQGDSFYIRPMIVHYGYMGNDTIRYEVQGYRLADVYAMPKMGFLIDWRGDGFGISGAGGHQHFYWIKSGWIFRAWGLGYAGLHLLNSALYNDSKLDATSLAIAGGAFLFGVWLKHAYKLTLRTGKKYHLEMLNLGN